MHHLFGTDGIRGIAGQSPLTPREILAIGRAAGSVLRGKYGSRQCRVVAVRDTRISGSSILKWLSRGLREHGIEVHDAGVLSTPSGAFLVRAHRYQSGVVISASHNPPKFNGIKFFSSEGRKWPDEWEALVERRVAAFLSGRAALKSRFPVGQHLNTGALGRDYEDFIVGTLKGGVDFSRLRIGVDCANGATFRAARNVFTRLGARIYMIGDRPNGRNINVECGSQHTERLSALVRKKRCDAGVAFDGDGDRVILVDENGRETDGDHIIALLAARFKKLGCLDNNSAVITVMANLGLKKALSRMRVESIEVPVGDRHVSAAMGKHASALGGEQSGHIILGHYLPTGDGLLTAVHVLAALVEENKSLSALTAPMKKYPQVLLNLPVKARIPIPQLDGVPKEIRRIERTLGSNGRVLIRYSGTEPLLRIMLEGPRQSQLRTFANHIAGCVVKAMDGHGPSGR